MTPRATRPALASARAAGLSDARRAAPATSAEAVDRMLVSTCGPPGQTSTPTRRTRQRAKADPSLSRAGAHGGTPPVTSCFVMRRQVMPYWMHGRAPVSLQGLIPMVGSRLDNDRARLVRSFTSVRRSIGLPDYIRCP
jgi:hypothetical protein